MCFMEASSTFHPSNIGSAFISCPWGPPFFVFFSMCFDCEWFWFETSLIFIVHVSFVLVQDATCALHFDVSMFCITIICPGLFWSSSIFFFFQFLVNFFFFSICEAFMWRFEFNKSSLTRLNSPSTSSVILEVLGHQLQFSQVKNLMLLQLNRLYLKFLLSRNRTY